MLRRFLLLLGIVSLVVPWGLSCTTTEPVIWSWPHNKRRAMTILNGFHRFHMDVDRIIFDMEEYPIEAEY